MSGEPLYPVQRRHFRSRLSTSGRARGPGPRAGMPGRGRRLRPKADTRPTAEASGRPPEPSWVPPGDQEGMRVGRPGNGWRGNEGKAAVPKRETDRCFRAAEEGDHAPGAGATQGDQARPDAASVPRGRHPLLPVSGPRTAQGSPTFQASLPVGAFPWPPRHPSAPPWGPSGARGFPLSSGADQENIQGGDR